MTCEFVSKVSIKRSKNSLLMRSVLTFGIIVVTFSIFIEVLIGNYFSLALCVPMFYIINFRNQMGRKTILKDVIINIKSSENQLIITIFNSVFFKKELCTNVNKINKDEIRSIQYSSQDSILQIYCDCLVDIVNDNIVIDSKKYNRYLLEIIISQKDLLEVEKTMDQSIIKI